MKKLYVLFIAMLVAGLSFGQHVTVFDFESISPELWEVGVEDTIIKVANPLKDNVNSSDFVGQYTHKSEWQYCGLYLDKKLNSSVYNTFEFKYFIPNGEVGNITAELYTEIPAEEGEENEGTLKVFTFDSGTLTGTGAWVRQEVAIPNANKLNAISLGFNQNFVPGVAGNAGTTAYFDDLIIRETQQWEHTLYFEPFTNTHEHWSDYNSQSSPYSMNGRWIGRADLVSDRNIYLERIWDDDKVFQDTYGNVLQLFPGQVIDIPNIQNMKGYEEYSLAFEYCWRYNDSEEPWGKPEETRMLDVYYKANGAGDWIELPSVVVGTEGFEGYYEEIQDEEMNSISLRFSAENSDYRISMDFLTIKGLEKEPNSIPVIKGDNNVRAYVFQNNLIVTVEKVNSLEVIDLNGRTVAASQNSSVANVEALPAGIYIAKINTPTGIYTTKFAK